MKKATTYDDLLKLAERYGVNNNALFVAAARQYELQQQVIETIRKAIDEGEPTTKKEYVKGRENVCVHPLISQLPKHTDAANKTLAVMLDIIQKLGHETIAGDKLSEFLNG